MNTAEDPRQARLVELLEAEERLRIRAAGRLGERAFRLFRQGLEARAREVAAAVDEARRWGDGL